MEWNTKMLYIVMLGKHSGTTFYGFIKGGRFDSPAEFAKEMISKIESRKPVKIGCSSPYGKYTEFHCMSIDSSEWDWHFKAHGLMK